MGWGGGSRRSSAECKRDGPKTVPVSRRSSMAGNRRALSFFQTPHGSCRRLTLFCHAGRAIHRTSFWKCCRAPAVQILPLELGADHRRRVRTFSGCGLRPCNNHSGKRQSLRRRVTRGKCNLSSSLAFALSESLEVNTASTVPQREQRIWARNPPPPVSKNAWTFVPSALTPATCKREGSLMHGVGALRDTASNRDINCTVPRCRTCPSDRDGCSVVRPSEMYGYYRAHGRRRDGQNDFRGVSCPTGRADHRHGCARAPSSRAWRTCP